MIILGSLEIAWWTSYSVNWTFFTRCYGWGATSDYLFKIGDFAPTRVGWPKISGRRGRPPTHHFFSQKTRLNYLSYGIKIWTVFFFCFVTMHSFDTRTDTRTDRLTEFSSLDRVCIPCSAVKNFKFNKSRNVPGAPPLRYPTKVVMWCGVLDLVNHAKLHHSRFIAFSCTRFRTLFVSYTQLYSYYNRLGLQTNAWYGNHLRVMARSCRG